MAREQAKVRVAFIAGAGLSGSTLLEQALSQVDGCMSIGELYWMWKPYWPMMVCECGEQFSTCPFWQTVLAEAYGSEQDAVRARLGVLGDGLVAHSIAPTLVHSKTKFRLKASFAEIGALLEPIYRAIAANAGSAIIVDAAKSGLWGLCVSSATSIEPSVIHLVRDPRGFSYSNARARAFHYPPGSMTTPRGPTRSLVNWLLSNLEAEVLARRAEIKTTVLYEDLTRDPFAMAARITRTLGLDSDIGTVFRDGTLVVSRVGHAIGGNPRRPQFGSTVIAPDDEWRRSASRRLRMLAIPFEPLYHRYQRKARAAAAGLGNQSPAGGVEPSDVS